MPNLYKVASPGNSLHAEGACSVTPTQQKFLDLAAAALPSAWRDQWSMIEEDDPVIAAEYLLITSVAQALGHHVPGRVRIERLIRRAFRNAVMRGKLAAPVPAYLRQGRIDVVVAEDAHHFIPACLVELKRDTNAAAIEADADRMAILLTCTGANLPDLFGFCLFPIILSPDPAHSLDFSGSRAAELAKVTATIMSLRRAHPALVFNVQHFADFAIERPSIVSEVYDDGTTETVWDPRSFRMEPVAIIIEKH
jgi:hypothetical protein